MGRGLWGGWGLPGGLLLQASEEQAAIGWGAFLDGFLSPLWVELQQRYLLSIGSRRSGHRWVAGLIQQLWGVGWSMWDHWNEVLHGGPRVHQFVVAQQELDWAIARHFWLGLDGLPRRYLRWFSGSLLLLLMKPWHTKRAWLANVVAARDCLARWEQREEPCRAECLILYRWLERGGGFQWDQL